MFMFRQNKGVGTKQNECSISNVQCSINDQLADVQVTHVNLLRIEHWKID
jgi:hypothetical protein